MDDDMELYITEVMIHVILTYPVSQKAQRLLITRKTSVPSPHNL